MMWNDQGMSRANNHSLLRDVDKALSNLTLRYVEAYAALYPEVGASYAPVADGYVCFAGVDSPLSRATGIGLGCGAGFLQDRSADIVEDDIRAAEEYLQKRGARARVDSSPVRHISLEPTLKKRGYTIDHLLNLYCLDIRGLRGQSPISSGPAPSTFARPEISVIRLSQENPDDDRVWSLTVGQGFAGTDDPSPPYMDIYRTIFHAQGTHPFLVLVDGTAAGGGALKVSSRVAVLSTASTRREFRRMGVQSALLKARLDAAREMGCEVAAVQATPGSDSERNIVRAGFSHALTMADWVKR